MSGRAARSRGVRAIAFGMPPAVTRSDELPERRLCELALEGDRDAWDALIERHDYRVIVALLARGVLLPRARELAQQTWIRLVAQQRAGKLDRLELPGLAIRQARFLALDDARRREPAAAPIDALIDPAASVEQRLIDREQLARATAELARCSPRARAVFALVYTEPQLPHAEIARRLGLSVQRVRQILCEVRARLRGAIEEPSDA
jgi:RNA polymerase sigma factor (sigma-70 family)